MSIERDLYREVLYSQQLLGRVASDLESLAGREVDRHRRDRLAACAMQIRQRRRASRINKPGQGH